MPDHARTPVHPSVAYVLKAFPRLSETYINSEIHRLEQAGLHLRLYATKPPEPLEAGPHQPVVDRIRAAPVYLPAVTSVSGVSLTTWLRRNLKPFLGPLARTARRRPVGLARATAAALAQAVRARPRPLSAAAEGLCQGAPPGGRACRPPAGGAGCATSARALRARVDDRGVVAPR